MEARRFPYLHSLPSWARRHDNTTINYQYSNIDGILNLVKPRLGKHMPVHSTLRWLFLANAVVLITHQIDAAYWHEWELFHIPGGNQLNLLLNIPIIALVLYAHNRIVTDIGTGLGYYKLLAALGYLTVGVHSFFFMLGGGSFRQPMSIALLLATFVLSTWQLLALRGLKDPAQFSPKPI